MITRVALAWAFVWLHLCVLARAQDAPPAPAGDPLVQATLQVYAEMAQSPGNVTVLEDGRVIASLAQHFEPEIRVVEVKPDGSTQPFPDEVWNSKPPRGLWGRRLNAVLGLQSDMKGMVWLLDNGHREDHGVKRATPKLVGWDTRSNSLKWVIELGKATRPNSFVNDLAVDAATNTVYIADPAGDRSAIIVVDTSTGRARRVLEGHVSVVPENIDLVIDKKPVQVRQKNGAMVRPRVGVNPIALDARGQWLYFGPLSGLSMYRARTADLRDAGLTPEQLAERVERYADKPVSDGSSVDTAGNVYISDLINHAIGVITPDRQYRVLIQDERLQWPDSFAFGPDGFMYFVVSQLHKGPVLNGGVDASAPPYHIYRFKPLAPGVVGR